MAVNSTESSVEESVTIYYHDAFQFEIIDSKGARVLIDVEYPSKLTLPATESDILLTTTVNYHSYSEEFVETFPGEQLFVQEGQIKTDRVSITGMASAFNKYESIPEDSTNYIYLVEMGGLRIAVLGQIGQDEFTPAQLETLGEIDIVLTQFVSNFSMIDANNQTAFALMDHLGPKLIIPTAGNGSQKITEIAAERWDLFAAETESVTISAPMLSADTQFLIMGSNAETMQALFDIPGWEG